MKKVFRIFYQTTVNQLLRQAQANNLDRAEHMEIEKLILYPHVIKRLQKCRIHMFLDVDQKSQRTSFIASMPSLKQL